MKKFKEWLNLHEGLNYPCIVVDVQPEYCKDNPRSFVSAPETTCEKIIRFVARQTGPVLMFVNAETSGYSLDTLQEIKEYWEETIGYYEDEYGDYQSNLNWSRFEIVDKGYGHFRNWMDRGVPDNIIIATIRELYQQKEYSSEQLEFEPEKTTSLQKEIMNTIEEMGGESHDPIYVNWTSVSQLKRFSGAYIMGGGRNECLREVELLMNAFNIKYKRIDSLVY